MAISKILHFFKSFRNKAIFALSLIIIAGILLVSKYVLNKETSGDTIHINEVTGEKQSSIQLSNEQLSARLSPGIDSVLHNFGIKNEWITSPSTDKNVKVRSEKKEAELFIKNVLIPADLTSIEVNADISSYISSLGLSTQVNEDIISKDVTIIVSNNDSAAGNIPLAKINIIHSDKVIRESAIVCLIISNINEYSPEEVDKLLISKNEFSFVFPRNLDDIDLQNRLLHGKKDVIINLTVGNKDNYEADFNAAMDDKSILERVKSFSVDFPTVTTVLLTSKDQDIPPNTFNAVTAQLSNYRIRVIPESGITQLLSASDISSKEKFRLLAQNIRSKGALAKTMVSTVNVTSDDFESFYDNILTLKKLGYKFYNFSDYASRKDAFEKQQKEKEDKINELKLKEQKQKEQKQKEQKQKEQKQKEQKKKAPDKKTIDKKAPDKKTDNKSKTELKKKTDTKKTLNKKTDTNKKTDVKKK